MVGTTSAFDPVTPVAVEVGLFRLCNNCTGAACPANAGACENHSLVDSDNGAWKAAAIFFIFACVFCVGGWVCPPHGSWAGGARGSARAGWPKGSRAAARPSAPSILSMLLTAGLLGAALLRAQPALVNPAKVALLVSCVWMIIGVVLFPLGFSWLEDTCRTSTTVHCGLACGDSTADMGFFSLCAPYDVGCAAMPRARRPPHLLPNPWRRCPPSAPRSDSAWLMIAGAVLLFVSNFVASMLRVAAA